jgi:2-methylaconitate cis-trans-isomerase PrpF
VVHEVTNQEREGEIRIGHTSGVMPVRARVDRDGEAWQVEEAVYYRTARRLAEGIAFIRRGAVPAETAG